MNFSKTASYSLTILGYMASNIEESMSAAYLHRELAIPYPYLRRILTDLSKSGFIHSSRGRRGGFVFSKPIEEIYLSDIIDSTDGMDSLNKCIMGFTECPFNARCAMHDLWASAREGIIQALKKTSLKDVIMKEHKT